MARGKKLSAWKTSYFFNPTCQAVFFFFPQCLCSLMIIFGYSCHQGPFFFCLALLLRCLRIEVACKHLQAKHFSLLITIHSLQLFSISLEPCLTGTFLLCRASLDHETLFLPHQVFSSIFPGKTWYLFWEFLLHSTLFLMSRSHPVFFP